MKQRWKHAAEVGRIMLRDLAPPRAADLLALLALLLAALVIGLMVGGAGALVEWGLGLPRGAGVLILFALVLGWVWVASARGRAADARVRRRAAAKDLVSAIRREGL